MEVGNNTVIAAQAGISGSTKIGNGVMIGGQAGIVGHIQIADGSKINAQAGLGKSLKNLALRLLALLHMIIIKPSEVRQLPAIFLKWKKNKGTGSNGKAING